MERAADMTPNPVEPPPRRRSFFRWVTYGLGGLASAVVALPFVGYILGAKPRRDDWVDLGPVDDYAMDETRLVTFDNPIRQPWDGMVARTGVYVRREAENDQFRVFAVNCAHLGCPVEWFPQSGLFMCPCHGGVYHADGERASGPPPRGLFACTWRVRDGKLEVRAPHYPTLQDTESHPA
jgi:menaquinol-cytochrome c reductase iron-sulfur subunit